MVPVAAILGQVNRAATGQHHIALIAEQTLASQYGRHQRGRTGGINSDTRPLEIELIGDAGGGEVLVIAQTQLPAAHDFEQFSMAE